MAEGVPHIALADGNSLPQLGFGVGLIANADCPYLVGEALRLGYRLVDTAQAYGNEQGVGSAIAHSGIPRSELFVTSKLRNGAHGRDLALASFDETMVDLGLEQLDLFLIHWPVPEQDLYVEAWQTLIELKAAGHIRSIGVSNFDPLHIDRLIAETGTAPVVNQIELHPRFQQRDLRAYHKRRDIRLESWSPLGPGNGSAQWWSQHGREVGQGLLDDPAIVTIAERHSRTPAQILLRWHIQEGLILCPKSSQPERIAENFALFDFALDAEDMYRIEALDDPRGRIGAAPSDWNVMF